MAPSILHTHLEPTEVTFDQLFDDFKKEYHDNFAPAAGLFWTRSTLNDNEPVTLHGLRIEAPTLMKEFIDNVKLGRDPEGFLFFKDVKDLDSKKPSHYDVFYNKNVTDDQRAVVVRFYHNYKTDSTTGKDLTKYYAKFLAKDPERTVQYLINGKSGGWKDLEVGSASANLKKYTDEPDFTMTMKVIGMEATFNLPASIDSDGTPDIDVWGNLTFKKLSDIAKAKYADYNDDRIIFYEHSGFAGSGDFLAYFIPLESAPVKALGDLNFESDSVEWAKIDA